MVELIIVCLMSIVFTYIAMGIINLREVKKEKPS